MSVKSPEQEQLEDTSDVELSEEELEQVVGGLDQGWWPDMNEPVIPH